MKKKLYGSVLLVGGGLALPGAAAALQSRLETRLPQGSGGAVEVFSNPRVCRTVYHALTEKGAGLGCETSALSCYVMCVL